MSTSTERARWLAVNLQRYVPTDALALDLSVRAGVPMAHVRGMLAGALLPCPRTMGLIAVTLGTTPAALLEEPDA